MDVRNIKIAEAAVAVVTRYGLRKTTMADLASAAGVSRQTLYNAYQSKEEVVRDAIRHVTAKGIAEVQDIWAGTTDLSAQLDVFFTKGPLAWFDWIASAPDAADLVDGLYSAGGAEMAEGVEKWIEALTPLFTPYAEQLAALGQTPEMVARFVYMTAQSAKSSALTRDDLVASLSTLHASVLALTGQSQKA